MNILHSNIDDGLMRKKQREKGNLPIEQENWVKEKNEKNYDGQMCTTNTKDGKNDKEIKSLYFMRLNTEHNDDDTKNNDNNNECIPMKNASSCFTTSSLASRSRVEEHEDSLIEQNLLTLSPSNIDPLGNFIPTRLLPIVNETTSISTLTSSYVSTRLNTITSTNNIVNDDNKWDEQDTDATPSGDERAAMTTANVDDGGENQRGREKGERERVRPERTNEENSI